MATHQLFIVPLVFENEFRRLVNTTTCQNIDTNTIKKFTFPSKFVPDESSAQILCERYCSRKAPCWGCILNCEEDGNCNWIAVSDCALKGQDSIRSTNLTAISQKPGTQNTQLHGNIYIDNAPYVLKYCELPLLSINSM